MSSNSGPVGILHLDVTPKPGQLTEEEKEKLAKAIKSGMTSQAQTQIKDEMHAFMAGTQELTQDFNDVVATLKSLAKVPELKALDGFDITSKKGDRIKTAYTDLLWKSRTAAGTIMFHCKDFRDVLLSQILIPQDIVVSSKNVYIFSVLSTLEEKSVDVRAVVVAWEQLGADFEAFVANYNQDVLAGITWEENAKLKTLTEELQKLQADLDESKDKVARINSQVVALHADEKLKAATGIGRIILRLSSTISHFLAGVAAESGSKLPDATDELAKQATILDLIKDKKAEIDALGVAKQGAQKPVQQLAVKLANMQGTFKDTAQMLGLFTDILAMLRHDIGQIGLSLNRDPEYAKDVASNTAGIDMMYDTMIRVLTMFQNTF